jgi:cytochrome c biogenesis protein
MATIERNITAAAISVRSKATGESFLSRFLGLLASVRFGIVLLCLLALACLVGMLVMQQNVDGFENYYAALTPAQQLVYAKLGFFNIYHVWYFNGLLALLSLNIVLASVDRFPKTWVFVSRPQITVPLRWLKDQKQSAEFEMKEQAESFLAKAQVLLKANGWRRTRVAEKNGNIYVFGEKGVWNRLGAYPVHVALLLIFVGGFLTAEFGITGSLPLAPGDTSKQISETVVDLDKVNQMTWQLPFEVTATDIEQKLIKKDGPISAMNTIDWITRFTIKDETGTHEAMVQMNRPFDYRGYRFFQASFVSTGRARNITLDVTPENGGPAERVEIPRDGSTILADGTRIRFVEFRGSFSVGQEDPDEDTSSYPNPGAVLQVIRPGGNLETAYAFGPQMANMPVAKKPVAGYTYSLADFEKVSDKHILSVQRDPGATVVYAGFALLFLTLVATFFFAHQRVWVTIEEAPTGALKVVTGGNTNRNQGAFDERFRRFRQELESRAQGNEAI